MQKLHELQQAEQIMINAKALLLTAKKLQKALQNECNTNAFSTRSNRNTLVAKSWQLTQLYNTQLNYIQNGKK